MVTGIAKLLLQKNLPKLGNYLRNPSHIPGIGARDKAQARQFYREMGMPDTTGTELMRKGITATGGLAMVDFFSEDLPIEKVQEDTSPLKFKSGIEQEGGPPRVIKQPKIIPLPDKKDSGNKKLEK